MNHNMNNVEIIQLLPAYECRAIFANNDCTDYITTLLIAWALCIYKDTQQIFGVTLSDEMSGEWIFAPLEKSFIGYILQDETIDEREIAIRLEIIKEILFKNGGEHADL